MIVEELNSLEQKWKAGKNKTGTYKHREKKQEITQGGSLTVGPSYGCIERWINNENIPDHTVPPMSITT